MRVCDGWHVFLEEKGELHCGLSCRFSQPLGRSTQGGSTKGIELLSWSLASNISNPL